MVFEGKENIRTYFGYFFKWDPVCHDTKCEFVQYLFANKNGSSLFLASNEIDNKPEFVYFRNVFIWLNSSKFTSVHKNNCCRYPLDL